MATVYEILHGVEPKMEALKREHIVDKYSHNRGERDEKEGGLRDAIKKTKYFSMLWEAFAWAAVLGFCYDKRKPLQGETVSAFKYSVIYNNSNDIFYSLILFCIAKEGYQILKDPKGINNIIEEYANGGFEIVFSLLEEKGVDYFSDDSNFLQEVMDRKLRLEKLRLKRKNESDILVQEIKIDDGEGGDFVF
jgi:hypothetical protein